MDAAVGPISNEDLVALVGSWVMTGGPDQIDEYLSEHDLELVIEPSGGAIAYGPCNKANLGFLVAEGFGAVDWGAATERECEGVMDVDREFQDMISHVERWTLDGDILILEGAGVGFQYERRR